MKSGKITTRRFLKRTSSSGTRYMLRRELIMSKDYGEESSLQRSFAFFKRWVMREAHAPTVPVMYAALLCGSLLVLFAEGYHYDWDWGLLVSRDRQIIARMPDRVLCEAEMVFHGRVDGSTKGYECLVRQAVAEYKAEGYRYKR